jgi:hypothetical protein
MTTLILLTPHPGDLDCDLDQNSNYSSKMTKGLMSTADTAHLFGKIMNIVKARPVYCKHFSLKWVLQWVKKAGDQGWNSHASKTYC